MFTLKNVSFEDIINYPDISIAGKKAVFVSGESGTGKSTLLKLLNGVVSPTEGSIYYLGKELEEYEPIALRREVLLVSQSVFLFDMIIKENFDEYSSYRGNNKLSEEEMLNFLNICSVQLPLDSQCAVLSGGERHRIFTAINLSLGFDVLMLDEPTSALDEKNADNLMAGITDYCRHNGKSLIVVTHDKAIAQKYADDIITLKGGRHNE